MDAADLRTDHGMSRAKPTNEGAEGTEGKETISKYRRGLAVTSNTSIVSFTFASLNTFPTHQPQILPKLGDEEL